MKAIEDLMTEHNAVLLDKVGEALEAGSDQAPQHLLKDLYQVA